MKKAMLALLVITALLAWGCSGEKSFSVKYEVRSSSNNVSIYYMDSEGNNNYQLTHQSVFPWTYEFTRTTPFDVMLQVTENGLGNPITATVTVGGSVFQSKCTTSTAQITGTIEKSY